MTGPHTVVKASGAYTRDTLVGYRQKRPYSLALPMTHNRYFWNPSSSTGVIDDLINGYAYPFSQSKSEFEKAYATAYSHFVGKLGDTASLGVSLVQYGQAKRMIEKRANTLVSFGSAVLRHSPLGVARSLSIPLREAQRVMKKHRPRKGGEYAASQSLADLWLEFWFGWKPAVCDIYSAMEVLSDPLPVTRLKGTGKSVLKDMISGGDYPATRVYKWAYATKAALGADVSVINPNLRLLQQLGLLNPYVVAFDAIPWSFVLGWFTNINSWLSSFTDFAGLDIQRAYTVRRTECTLNVSWRPCDPSVNWGCTESEQAVYRSWVGDGYLLEKERKTLPGNAIPYPALKLKFSELKPTRALTAISLLVQKLPRR